MSAAPELGGIHPELSTLISNEVVQPSQWADMHRGSGANDPIKRLAVAIIEQAICDLQMTPQPEPERASLKVLKPRRAWEAEDWFSREDSTGESSPSMEEVLLKGITFDQCCGILGINPEPARKRILSGAVIMIRRHMTVVGRVNPITPERKR